MGKLIEHQDYLVKPEGFNIPYDAERIHGISTELAEAEGIPLAEVLEKFNIALSKTKFIVGQNLGFDVNIMGCEFHQNGNRKSSMSSMPVLDTCTEVTASLSKISRWSWWQIQIANLNRVTSISFQQVPFCRSTQCDCRC